MSVDESLRRGLAEEQRRANLAASGIPTLEDVDRRRHQIAIVGLFVAVGLLFAILLTAHVITVGSRGWIDTDVARFGIIGFALAMVVYAFDQERHLRRVEQHRAELIALDRDVAGNLLTAGIVLDAVTSVHSSIELGVVLPSIVAQGCALVGGDHGVLFLAEDDGPMEVAVDADGLAASAAPLVELVVGRRGIVGIVEDGTIDIGVPVTHGDAILAVLVLPKVVLDRLTDDTKGLLARFGAAAGAGLANARRHEAAVFLLDVRA